MWEGYFNEKNKEQWEETADSLRHINDHVLQDIEDFILLKGFKKGKKPNEIKDEIERHRIERANVEKQLSEEPEQVDARLTSDHKKRKFLNELRPPKYWNFVQKCPEDLKVKHILRFDANPAGCY